MLLVYWDKINPCALIFNEPNDKSSIFNYYLFNGFTLCSQTSFSSTFCAMKLFYATSLKFMSNRKTHVPVITESQVISFLGDTDVTTAKLFPWNIFSHSSFRGWGWGLLVRSLLIKHSEWKLDSFGMAGQPGEADTWKTLQETWQPRVTHDCFTFQTLILETGTPAAPRMPSHLALFKSSLARALFRR